MTVSEPTDDSTNDIELTVERSPGTFGRVTVDYQVYTYTFLCCSPHSYLY